VLGTYLHLSFKGPDIIKDQAFKAFFVFWRQWVIFGCGITSWGNSYNKKLAMHNTTIMIDTMSVKYPPWGKPGRIDLSKKLSNQ
jgi:hypothetical protein